MLLAREPERAKHAGVSSTPLLSGLVAASFTPFCQDGSIDVGKIPGVIEHVLAQGAAGFYVCGSTGEGPLLTTAERQLVAETIVQTVKGRVPVVIQVGHNSLADARVLAAHAQQIGAAVLRQRGEQQRQRHGAQRLLTHHAKTRDVVLMMVMHVTARNRGRFMREPCLHVGLLAGRVVEPAIE